MEEFYRIRRLPPYVFEEVNKAKAKARNAGADIVDLGMGNPDLPAPQHVIDKLKETLGKLLGDPDNFDNTLGRCAPNVLYPEFGLSFASAPGAPASDLLVSMGCNQVVSRTFSWPHPATGMKTDTGKLIACIEAAGTDADIVFKVVVFDEEDYLFARQLLLEFPGYRWYLQPGNATPRQDFGDGGAALDIDSEELARRCEWLLRRALEDGWSDVTILPQLHTLLWGNKRGV